MNAYPRVLFLSLPRLSPFYFTELPVGIACLEEFIEAAGIETEVLDMNLGYTRHDLVDTLRRFEPGLLAVQMYSVQYMQAYRLLAFLKTRFPRMDIIIGGPHAACFREQILAECGAVDFVLPGEGELSLRRLCLGESPESIPDLIHRTDGCVTANPPGELISDLDVLPFPRYRKFELERFTRCTMDKVFKISLCGSRGCPYRCTFCASGLTMGKRYRHHSTAWLLDAVEYWYDRGCRAFSFVDDGFTFHPQRVFEFCDGIEKRRLEECEFSLNNGIRADRMTRDMLIRMKEVGFWRLGIGVEAGTQKVLNQLKKGEKIEKIRDAIRLACELHYNVMLYFLVGPPGETIEDLEESFRLALEFPVDAVSFNNIVPYPGTELYNYLRDNDLLLARPEEYLSGDPRHANRPIFQTPEIPEAERRKVLRRAFHVEREAARRAMVRKLHSLGFLSRVFARGYSFPLIREHLMANPVFRHTVLEPVKRMVHRRH